MLTARLVQTAPERNGVATNVEHAESAIQQAASDNVDLLVFPELALTGYHLSPAEFRECRAAVEAGLTRLAAVANDVTVILGTPTYEPLRNSAVVLANGTRVGSYDKTHLYDAEVDVFEPGDSLDPIETPVGTIGVEICYDVEFPEVARELAFENTDLLVTISANMRPFHPYQEAFLSARAMENGLPHLLCNRVGVEDETNFFGGSGVVDVHGNSVGSAVEDDTTVLTVTLDPSERQDETLTYHADRRPALYQRAQNSPAKHTDDKRTVDN